MKRLFLGLLIFVVSVIYFFPIISSTYNILDWFTTDDSFYYFKIAENISLGYGSTFDGFSPVNGYHPFWLILLIPVFFGSRIDPYVPLRIVILIQYLLSVSAIILFYRYLSSRLSLFGSALISLVWLLLIPIFLIATNGTESILNMFCLTLFWVLFSRYTESNFKKSQFRDLLGLGLAATLLLFARLDNIFLILVFGGWLGIRYLASKNWKITRENIAELIKLESTYLAPGAILLGAYFGWNKIIIGTVMPLSGQVKKYWGTLPETIYGSKVLGIGNFLGEFFSGNENLGPWSLLLKPFYAIIDQYDVYYNFGTDSISIGLIFGMVLLLFLGFIVGKNEAFFLQKVKDWNFVPLFLGSIIHIVYYKFGGYLAPRSWYWLLESFTIILVLAMFIEIIFQSIVPERNVFRTGFALGLLLLSSYLVVLPHMNRITEKFLIPKTLDHEYLQIASWLENNTESNSVIGMTGAGSTAYFIEDRVIMNLDGLVNGKRYFDLIKKENAEEYLFENNVTYIFGNEYVLLETDPYRANYLDLLDRGDLISTYNGKMKLWRISD